MLKTSFWFRHTGDRIPDFKEAAQKGWQSVALVLRYGFSLVGAAAIAFVAVNAFSPGQFGNHMSGILVASSGVTVPASAADPLAGVVPSPERRAIAEYLAKRYRVAIEAAEEYVYMAYAAGRRTGLDPLLILSVVAVESRFNPVAESDMGAKGLMQVIPKYHEEKLVDHGGIDTILDPSINIYVGSQILKEYIRQTGSVETGLQFYNGAPFDLSGQYAQRVLAEHVRLQQVIARPVRLASNTSS